MANVLGYIDRSPSRLAEMKRALDRRFDTVWSPSEGCVMATRALPRSLPDSEHLRAAGVAFAEGRDAVSGHSATDLALGSLQGDVGLVRSDGDRMVAVRSGPGTVPWYAWQDSERALVTTSFTDLVSVLPVAPELDPLVCALWAGMWAAFPDGRSFLRGVTVIPPGHTAEVQPGQPVRPRLWWDPWPQEQLPWPSRATRAEHVERFGHAVLSVLDREAADERVNLLSLSGGVDSSVIAYLVARHLGRPLAGLSFVPPVEGPEARLEASYLDPLVVDLGIDPHVRLPLDDRQRLVLAAEALPVVFPVLHPVLQVLPRLAREHGLEVLVGGEFADELCGGWFALPDWVDAVSLPRLLSMVGALPRGRSDLRAWARSRVPGRLPAGPWPESLADWVHPEAEAEYQSWRSEQLSTLRASAAPHSHQRAWMGLIEGALAMNWEACSALGVRRAFPFLSAEVLEVVSACHPVELLGPGPKRLERQAFAGLVPDRYLHRPDKSGWRGVDDELMVDPPAVPLELAATLGEDLGPLPPGSAAALTITCRFAEQLATTAKGTGPAG